MPQSESLIHDLAWAEANNLLDLLGAGHTEEDQRQIFAVLYNSSRSVIEKFLTQQERLDKRICPSKN